MARLLVHHKVKDYAAWRKVFDEVTVNRTRFGSTGQQVYRAANDPNELFVVTDWHNLEEARAYAQSPELREAMQHAGVISQPEVTFLEEA
jgi:heme-degrading monooxygenase HmoA